MARRTTRATICLCVRNRHSWIAARAATTKGPGEVPRPFIHPVWMHDAVWGQTVRSAGQTGMQKGMIGGPNWLGQRA